VPEAGHVAVVYGLQLRVLDHACNTNNTYKNYLRKQKKSQEIKKKDGGKFFGMKSGTFPL
jgi:hypothetical protein